MNTEDLTRLLASGLEPAARDAIPRRLALALGAGLGGAVLVLIAALGVRADIAADAARPMFWVKLAFVAALVAGGLFALGRLSRPGARLAWIAPALALPPLAMWAIAAVTLAGAQPKEHASLVFGQTWQSCPFNIALLAVPVMAAAFWAMRSLAPTRLRMAGAAAGLFAGATGALVYTAHCPELAAPFLAIWYLLGMLIPVAAGALLGPRWLRW